MPEPSAAEPGIPLASVARMDKTLLRLCLTGFPLLTGTFACDDTQEAALQRSREAETEARGELREAKQELAEARDKIRELDEKTKELANRAKAKVDEAAAETKEELRDGVREAQRKIDEADKAVARTIRGKDEHPDAN